MLFRSTGACSIFQRYPGAGAAFSSTTLRIVSPGDGDPFPGGAPKPAAVPDSNTIDNNTLKGFIAAV